MKITKLITFYSLLAIISLLSSCNNQKFEVTGTITNAKDSTLYLENVGLDGVEAVDSVKLGEDGAFSFRQNANDAPEFYRLRIDRQIINLSIDSTETVTFKAEYPSMAYKYEVEGSENCAKIKELALHQMSLQSKVNSIINNPQFSVSNINDSLPKVIDAYKDFVKKNYIFKEPNKSYAYFALFQTVVVGNSYSLIFNPRANEDDVKVFAAVATSWDVYHPGAIRGENLHNIAIEGLKDVRIIRAKQEATIDPDKINTTGIVDITLTDNKGNVRRLSDLKGKVVILDFCSFAQEGVTERIMQMRDIYNRYHSQGLEIYQVSLDGNQHFWKTQTAALPWISVNDPDGVQSQNVMHYNVMSLPTFFLLDKTCQPVKRDVQIEDIDKEIKALL